MTRPAAVSRRSVAASIAGLAAFVVGDGPVIGEPLDRGIGGTGLSRVPEEATRDRGIGGTGFVGTIRRFGSIVVNDIRIAYSRRVMVTIDDVVASPADLKLGQVVHVTAVRRRGVMSTRAIAVTSEVVGAVQATAADGMVVLGQRVSLVNIPPDQRRWHIGDHVAVSGLRESNGTIVASLIESRVATDSRVAGPVVLGTDGFPALDGLRLVGLDPRLIGHRCIVEGVPSDVGLAVTRARNEQTLLIADRPRLLSVEAYVARTSEGLVLGSGINLGVDHSATSLPAGSEARAVVEIRVRANGRLDVEALRPEGYSRHGSASDRSYRPLQGPGQERAASRDATFEGLAHAPRGGIRR